MPITSRPQPYIKQEFGGTLPIGSEIVTVRNVFGKIFNSGTEFQRDGSQFDRLFNDVDTFKLARSRRGSCIRRATLQPT